MRHVGALLSRCYLSHGGCAAAVQSRLFSAGSTEDPFGAPTSGNNSDVHLEAVQLGDMPDVATTGASGPPDSGRWFAKKHNAPPRKQMYHRRHREQKKLEKQQQRLEHLQKIHLEASERGDTRLSMAAGGEAERLQLPWLQRNVPVKPPAHASVSRGLRKQVKVVNYSGDGLPRDDSLGLATETRSMSVLNFKVGYAVDAQYALPGEVQAFVLDQSTFCLYGVDKNQVTQIASNIRRIRPPEPYKGHGIRVVGESVKIKERKMK